MPQNYFGEDCSATTTRPPTCSSPPQPTRVVNFLAELATDGKALELGIGTGRIALPLAQRGIRVHGIDLSDAMVARACQPGADQITVTIGDFATTRVAGRFFFLPPSLVSFEHDHESDDAG